MKKLYSYRDFIEPLLENLNWKGRARQVKEALPPKSAYMDLQALCDSLSHLGYESTIENAKPQSAGHYYPFLFLDENQKPRLVRHAKDLNKIPNKTGKIIFFTKKDPSLYLPPAASSVFRQEIKRFAPLLKEILIISLIIGTVSLAPILYNRSIYDHIIAAGSSKGYEMLLIGVMAALAAEVILRFKRNNRLAFFGGRIDHYVSCSVFERLLFLPPIYTERTSTSSQLARLRDFESVREFFTGPLSTLFFEFPLISIYLIVMACFSGWLALVPVLLIACYACLIYIMGHRLKSTSRLSSTFSTRRQEFLLETVTKLRAIRLAGMDDVWQARYRKMSGDASLASFRSSISAQLLENISYALMMLGGTATLALGVMLVIAQSITVGTLIASMMMIWRIIAPLQICCASLTRIQQLSSSTKQVERMLSVTPEHDPNSTANIIPKMKGFLSFHRVSLKYSPDTEPALLGVSLDIKPGQIVAIKGNNGSGKSTLLKLALGLYQPQAGSVRIDGIDIRQFDPLVLRQNIAYVPQNGDFFPGTIRDNFMFSNPDASESDIETALIEACAFEEVNSLPDRLDSLVEIDNHSLISFALRQKLNLARAYIRKASIYLFDEASYSLGLDNDIAFEKKIQALRGTSTVFMATHREDHMRLADQLLFMNKGELTHAGPPDKVLNVLKGKKA